MAFLQDPTSSSKEILDKLLWIPSIEHNETIVSEIFPRLVKKTSGGVGLGCPQPSERPWSSDRRSFPALNGLKNLRICQCRRGATEIKKKPHQTFWGKIPFLDRFTFLFEDIEFENRKMSGSEVDLYSGTSLFFSVRFPADCLLLRTGLLFGLGWGVAFLHINGGVDLLHNKKISSF